MEVRILVVIGNTGFQIALYTIAILFAITLLLSHQLQTKNQYFSADIELNAYLENILNKM